MKSNLLLRSLVETFSLVWSNVMAELVSKQLLIYASSSYGAS